MINIEYKKIPKEWKITSGYLDDGSYQVVQEAQSFITTLKIKIGKWEKMWVFNSRKGKTNG